MSSIVKEALEIHSTYFNEFMPAIMLKKIEMRERINTLMNRITSDMISEAPSTSYRNLLKENDDYLQYIYNNISRL